MQKDDVRQKCDDVRFLLGGDAVVAGDLQKADEVVPLGNHRPQDGEVLIVRVQDGALFRQRALIGVGDRLVDGDAAFRRISCHLGSSSSGSSDMHSTWWVRSVRMMGFPSSLRP